MTPDYILDSVKNGSWLAEGPYEVAIFTSSSAAFYPVRQWREKVSKGRITGAFQGWRVLLMVQEPTRRAMFKRWAAAEKLFPSQNVCVQTKLKAKSKMSFLVVFTQAAKSRQSRSIQLSSPHLHLHHSCHGKTCYREIKFPQCSLLPSEPHSPTPLWGKSPFLESDFITTILILIF